MTRYAPGYRKLSEPELDRIEQLKLMEREVLGLIYRLTDDPEVQAMPRDLALARTNIQTGFMWAVRAVAKPHQDFDPPEVKV